ncbi:leucine-rich repeat domain-containing protein [Prevotella merdae]|uniref:leucine-rich repeat domain-containing protein n=1 Tax=Prevotella merdae TaxID=2079531 RepID=UPI003F7D2EF9
MHNIKQLYSIHFGRAVVYTLLALFLCVAGVGKAAAKTNYDPMVKLNPVSYTKNGTEVTLQLYMWYYSSHGGYIDRTANFKGDVNLYIDDKQVVNLKEMWNNISGVTNIKTFRNDQNTYRGKPVGNTSDIIVDNKNVGTAEFCNLKVEEKNPNALSLLNAYVCVIDLKLSFNSSFPYYGHKLTVKGKWYNKENYSSQEQEEDWTLDNTISGYVRPANLKVLPYGNYMELSWEKQGYNKSASDDGEWFVYKRENGERKNLGSTNNNTLRIAKSEHTCLSNYDVTFKSRGFYTTDTICGLTTSYIATGHKLNADDVCQYCNHSFFRYTTSDGKIVEPKNPKQFGANIVAHSVVDGKCVIEFDGPITKIPYRAFYDCKNLTGDLVIPNSVTEIGEQAFFNCTGLNGTLTLSSKLKKIGGTAFIQSGFTGTLKLPNSLTDIGGFAFMNCKYFTSLELPNALSVIPKSAFNGCKGLSGNLDIPNSVTEIGDQAFHSCTGFDGTLTLSNKLGKIGQYAFYGCTGFTGSLKLPSSVTTIGQSAFSTCRSFTKLELPNTLSVIPEEAFRGCVGLSGSLVIPDGVKEIGNRAFSDCKGFNGTLTLSNKLKTIGELAFYGCSGFTGSLTLPSSVTTIGQSAFSICRSFTKLELPNTLSVIPTQAFSDCSSLSGELVIPASVTEIGNNAFYGCQNLSAETGRVTLPKSLKKIGSDVFNFINNINTVNFQSLPEGISGDLGKKKAVSLSDDSYISDQASGTVNEISYTRQMSNNWGTLVLPYPLTLTGEESYRLYAISAVSENELVLKQLNGEVAAGTPCVVKRNGSEAELTFDANNAELNMAINDQPMDGMKFSGTYWTKDVDNGYIIAKDCFWNVAELNKSDLVKGVKVKPFRAWLDGTSPNGASQLSICVSDTATGIGAAGTIDALNDTATEYYDLSGKRLDDPQRGVNIVRMKSGKTKKIIIK